MRINWVRWGLYIWLVFMLFILAWGSDYWLTLRPLSLGEPDPMLFVIMGVGALFVSTYSFYQWQRNIGAVLVTNKKRISLHNIDEFGTFSPPKSVIKIFEDLPDDERKEIDPHGFMVGKFSGYIGEGVQLIRAAGKGETVVVIAPTPLIRKHGDFVDCLAWTNSYIGLDQLKHLPPWVLQWCINNVPGFVPCGTEIIFGDSQHDDAVHAWDLDQEKPVWTRGVKGVEINYERRLTRLAGIITRLDDEVEGLERACTSAKAARSKTPPVKVEAEVNKQDERGDSDS